MKSADFLSMNVYIYYHPVSSGYNTELEKVKSADFLKMNIHIYYHSVSSGYNTELAAFHQLPDE